MLDYSSIHQVCQIVKPYDGGGAATEDVRILGKFACYSLEYRRLGRTFSNQAIKRQRLVT